MNDIELGQLKQSISGFFEGQANFERSEKLKEEILSKSEASTSAYVESLRTHLDTLRSHAFCQRWFGIWATHVIYLLKDIIVKRESVRPKTAL